MARLALTIQTVGRAGVDIGAGQAVLGVDDAELVNNGKTILKLQNTSGSAIIVTFVTPLTQLTSPTLAVADQTFSVPATSTRWIGPFPIGTYNNAAGKLDIDLPSDGVTMTAVAMEGVS